MAKDFKGKNAHRINEDIRVPMVRIVNDEDEALNGIIPTEQALAAAEKRGVDLVEIAALADPPVCRLVEYSKYKFEIKKKEKENKSKQHIVLLKEIRFGPNTDDHDFNFKVKHAENFIEEGHKIKTFVVFHGRTIVHKDRGYKILEDFIQALADVAKVEMPPKMEGKRLYLILAPKASKTNLANNAASNAALAGGTSSENAPTALPSN